MCWVIFLFLLAEKDVSARAPKRTPESGCAPQSCSRLALSRVPYQVPNTATERRGYNASRFRVRSPDADARAAPRTGQRILISCWRRRCRTSARRLQLQREPARWLINAGTVTLFDNRFRNSIREQFAIFPIARLVCLRRDYSKIRTRPALPGNSPCAGRGNLPCAHHDWRSWGWSSAWLESDWPAPAVTPE